MNDAFNAYLEKVGKTLAGRGFAPYGKDPVFPGVGGTWHRRAFEIAKFGLIDTFCCVAACEEPSADVLRGLGSALFDFGLAGKSFLPRGLFGGLGVFPVLVCPEVPPDVATFVKGYCPKHWASFEFPVVVDLAAASLVTYAQTPVWGAAYYKGFRDMARACFQP